jgi:glycosyltransferase involved in cell wall biosynthesis
MDVNGMRVALFVDSPSRRAHGNAASRLALGLSAHPAVTSVDIVCYSSDPAPKWLPSTVTVTPLGVDRSSRSLLPLARYLREQEPDVLVARQVHANLVALAAAQVARTARGWGGRVVVVQDCLVELAHASSRADNKWLVKLAYRRADGVIAPSPCLLDDVISWCHVDPRFTAVVPNAIPKSSTTPSIPPPHPWLRGWPNQVFVNVTNMLPFKRLDLLVQAFAMLSAREPDARLLILGDGPERVRTEDLVWELNLRDRVQVVGWVDEPQTYLAHAHSLVHTSDEEGFGQVLTEAMAVGCPVIVTDARGGGPRFVTDGGLYGALVPAGDAHSVAGAMARMLQPDVRERYSRLGLERVEIFSPEACAAALVDFLGSELSVTR